LCAEQQSWFAKELAELDASPLVFVTIHITRTMASTLSTSAANKLSDDEGAPTRTDYESPQLPNVLQVEIVTEKGYTDEEAAMHNSSVSSLSNHSSIIYGRPDAAARIREIVNTTEGSDSTIVAACGPEGLMLQVRRAVAGVVSTGTRSVSLHCEQFGW
jgi:CRISPR/Cas system type I-B associated protein Csh2 (Cas7 group RAMP superfamily)